MSIFEEPTKSARMTRSGVPDQADQTPFSANGAFPAPHLKGNDQIQVARDDRFAPFLGRPNAQVHPMIRLQRTIGNRAVQRMLKNGAPAITGLGRARETIQTKLEVNTPGDPFEQEAERVSDQVMRIIDHPMPAEQAPPIQRKCTECEEEENKGPSQIPLAVARQTIEGDDDEYPPVSQAIVLRKARFEAPHTLPEPAPSTAERLARNEGRGEALPAATIQQMESAFGRDFSHVRVHKDAEAGEISRQLSALAFTQGNHIYFGQGMYDPEGSSGRRLLAHELTHVVQQGHAPEQFSIQRTPAGVTQAGPPEIQRAANWAAGAVHEVNNLANCVLNGVAVGVTWPTLNGTIFWSTAAARAALAKPTLSFASAASGGVNASVATVPTNTASFDETVLAPGPWTLAVPKATIGGLFSSLAACTGAGNTTFQAIGDPSDAHMYTANRRHEDHHWADHRAAFNGSIVPWDAKLTAAQSAGTTFNGATQGDAEAALYAAMGGTSDQVADAFMNACAAAVVAFHSTPAGGPVGAPTSPASNADCSTSSAKYHNPS